MSVLRKCGGGGRHRRKLSFKSEELAFKRAAFFNTHNRLGPRPTEYVMRAYRCPNCGWWHLSSAKMSGPTPPHHVKRAQRVEASDTIQPAI